MELNIGGLRIGVDFGCPAVLALILLAADRHFLLEVLAVCLLHEGGHALAMWLTGAGLREIRFTGAGMQLRARTAVISRTAQSLVYLAGPLVNLLCGAVLLSAAPELAVLHLCMGGFNLLPYRVLDGGALLGLWTDASARPLCLLLTAGLCAVLLLHRIANPLLYLMLGYLAAKEWSRRA